MIEFKKGDRVIYDRGEAAEQVGLSRTVEATVMLVSEGHGDLKYTKPLYHIEWPPKGHAVVYAKSLQAID